MQPAQNKDSHAAALGQRDGQKRMAQLNAQERSALSRHALRARWHRRQFNEEQESQGNHLHRHTDLKRQAITPRLISAVCRFCTVANRTLEIAKHDFFWHSN
jgi:hypothetical protein